MWKILGRAVLDLLAPKSCPGCESICDRVESTDLFCGACLPLLETIAEGHRPPAPVAAVFVYGGPIAEAICAVKYRGRSDFAPELGNILGRAALPYLGRVDMVVPVPLFPRRLRARGFNQAALLAKPVAKTLGLPLEVNALRRIRDTPEQASLPREERVLNIRGAFRARPPRGSARVLLVDDVRTTGSTLAAASEALLDAGFSTVYALTLASAQRF
jgi:ComF family protein